MEAAILRPTTLPEYEVKESCYLNREKPKRVRNPAASSLQHVQLYVRSELRRPVEPLGCLLKVIGRCAIDIHKLVRVSINHRKPAALQLDHDSMTLEKRVISISEVELQLDRLVCDHRLRLGVAIAKSGAEDLSCKQHLKVSHLHVAGVGLVVGRVARINVDQFDHIVGVRS